GDLGQADSVLRRYRTWLTMVLVLVAGLGAVVATPAGRNQIALSITRVPAPYIALALDSLQPAKNGRELTVAFTVVGHEGAPATLPYEVDAENASGSRVASFSGTVAVLPEQPAPQHVTLTLPSGATWKRVEVHLVGRTESINVQNRAEGS